MKYLSSSRIKPNPDFSQLEKTLLRKGSPGHVPFYELYVNSGIMEKITGKKIKERVDTVEFYHKTGYDYVPAWPTFTMKRGSLVDTSTEYPIKDRETFEKYEWPKPSDISFREFESIVPVLPEGMRIIAQTGGIFEMSEYLCGYEGLCFMLLDDRPLVKAIFERIELLYETIYSGMSAIPEVGAVVISDDMGFKTQTLLPPNDLREFVLPLHKKLAGIIHKNKKPCILHSCGNLSAIMDEIIDDVGIDAKHSYEDAILPVTEAKKLYGKRIAILGGFDVDRLCRSTETEIRKYTRMLIEECGDNGAYALGSGNSIADYVPVENYLCMLDEAAKFRR